MGLAGRSDAPWQVLPASTTHALLRGGRILAAGAVDDVLTAELVTACFGHLGRRRPARWPLGCCVRAMSSRRLFRSPLAD
jgi:iron complex transport system ATP-binding protein